MNLAGMTDRDGCRQGTIGRTMRVMRFTRYGIALGIGMSQSQTKTPPGVAFYRVP